MTTGFAARWRLGLPLVLCACGWGCSTPDVQKSDLDYMVMFDGDGMPIDPMSKHAGDVMSYDELTEEVYAQRVDSIVRNIEASGKQRVVIFIHGGLNTQPESVARAVELHRPILDDGAYPIFINWQSNLYSSYRDHLLWLRRGREGSGWEAVFAPFYLLEDIVSGLIRFPVIAFSQVTEFLGLGTSGLALHLPEHENAKEAWDRYHQEAASADGQQHVHLSDVDYDRNPGHVYWTWIPTLPAKVVSIPVVSIAGPGSWDEMKHRVEVLFVRETDLEGEQLVETNHGILFLMTKLSQLQRRTGIQVDLIGHSMGTIVMNRILFRARPQEVETSDAEREQAKIQALGTPEVERLPVEIPLFANLVYLAAACNLRDLGENAIPYLQQHPDSQLFSVTLHPKSELSESNKWDLAPRGSLLVWIDDFLANPIGQGERTAGRADNLMVALYLTPPEIRDRVHVNVLPMDDDHVPQEHGEFTNPADTDGYFKFWEPACWFPAEAATESHP